MLSIEAVLLGGLLVVVASMLAFTWACCAAAKNDDEARARMRAAHVRQQMQDAVLKKLGDDDAA